MTRGWVFLSLILLLPSPARAFVPSAALRETAVQSLLSNLEPIGSQTYLTAGRHQFKSLWTRDFCFSAKALLELGKSEVVRDQIDLLLANRRTSDSLIPRTLDSIPAQRRVVLAVLTRLFPWLGNPPIESDLSPEYIGENGSPAIDSNILTLQAALDFVDATKDSAWWEKNKSAWVSVYRFYDAYLDQGLISQPAYSDWQDSVSRRGKTFLTNLLYYKVSARLAKFPEFGITEEKLGSLRKHIVETFWDYDQHLYRSVEKMPQISLDGNLLALDEASGLQAPRYPDLKMSALWNGRGGLPGFATTPDYPAEWVSPTAKWVGLSHYHDRMTWSWLLGLALKVAREQQGDESAMTIQSFLSNRIALDGNISELYDPDQGYAPWSSSLLNAEAPFSWGAALIIEGTGP